MIFIGVYDDWLNGVYTVKQVLKLTEEKVIVRSDGHYNETFSSALLHQKQVLLVKGEKRLKARGHGGENAHNYLSLYLRFCPDSLMIKIDPDTGVNHAPTLPCKFDVACNYVEGSLRGGAIAFSRNAAQTIVNSRLLLEKKYKPLRWCYRWREKEWIPCEDAILYDVIQRLGLNLVFWHDVYCRHREEAFNPPYSLSCYSLYHPIGCQGDS